MNFRSTFLIVTLALLSAVLGCTSPNKGQQSPERQAHNGPPPRKMGDPPAGHGLDNDGNATPRETIYTFTTAPVTIIRNTPVPFTLPNGKTHWYEVVYLPSGGVNWVQAKALAEQAGGYLASLHSDAENDFVFDLIKDEKYWFQWDETHNYVMNGPFIGGYQPMGSVEPAGGWRWVSGEPWTYDKWCVDGLSDDHDPRPNNQPNDATGNQSVTCYGEINAPVSYWGDFPHKFSSYNDPHKGKAYGFIIEYESKPANI